MTAIDKQGIERANKVARVIAEHPGLPMICLAPSTPSDYDSWYHDVFGAEVKKMLFPNEVAELYGDFFGLDCDRYYDDADDVAERIEDYWLWDNGHGKPMEQFHLVTETEPDTPSVVASEGNPYGISYDRITESLPELRQTVSGLIGTE